MSDVPQFHPAHFKQSVIHNLNGLSNHMTERGDSFALGLVGNLFELFNEINTNLNRVAVAQEQLVAIAQADFATAVEQEVTARLDPAVNAVRKEVEKRSNLS